MCVLLPRVCKPHESEDYVLNTSTFIPPRYQTCCCCLVTQSCPILCDPKYCSPQGSSVHGNSPGKSTGVGCHAPPGDLPNSGIEPRSPMSQVDSLPSEPPEKPKNTGVGRLSLLQGIFLTQESNQGLLHRILYQISYQGGTGTKHRADTKGV